VRCVGQIAEDRLREVMTTMGDRWTDDMFDELLHCSPVSANQFNYVDFVRAIKHGTRRDADDDTFKAAAPMPAAATGASTTAAKGSGSGSGGKAGGKAGKVGKAGSGGGGSSGTTAPSVSSELVVHV